MFDSVTTEIDLRKLKERLNNLQINAHLTTPEDAFFDAEDFPEWSLYDFAFAEYMNICGADCQIICNETPRQKGFINNSMAREVLCGMYKQKAIIMLHAPVFGREVDGYAQALIQSRLDKIYICDLLNLDTTDLANFLLDVRHKIISYGLTNYDLRTIKLGIQRHLRGLQGQ